MSTPTISRSSHDAGDTQNSSAAAGLTLQAAAMVRTIPKTNSLPPDPKFPTAATEDLIPKYRALPSDSNFPADHIAADTQDQRVGGDYNFGNGQPTNVTHDVFDVADFNFPTAAIVPATPIGAALPSDLTLQTTANVQPTPMFEPLLSDHNFPTATIFAAIPKCYPLPSEFNLPADHRIADTHGRCVGGDTNFGSSHARGVTQTTFAAVDPILPADHGSDVTHESFVGGNPIFGSSQSRSGIHISIAAADLTLSADQRSTASHSHFVGGVPISAAAKTAPISTPRSLLPIQLPADHACIGPHICHVGGNPIFGIDQRNPLSKSRSSVPNTILHASQRSTDPHCYRAGVIQTSAASMCNTSTNCRSVPPIQLSPSSTTNPVPIISASAGIQLSTTTQEKE